MSWMGSGWAQDGLRMGSGWAPDVPKSVLSFCHVSDQATSVFGFPTAKLGEGETRETSQVTSPSHDVPIPQWLRLQLVLQRSSAASQTQSMGQGRQGRRGSTEKSKSTGHSATGWNHLYLYHYVSFNIINQHYTRVTMSVYRLLMIPAALCLLILLQQAKHIQALTNEDGLRISTKSVGIFSCFSLGPVMPGVKVCWNADASMHQICMRLMRCKADVFLDHFVALSSSFHFVRFPLCSLQAWVIHCEVLSSQATRPSRLVAIFRTTYGLCWAGEMLQFGRCGRLPEVLQTWCRDPRKTWFIESTMVHYSL